MKKLFKAFSQVDASMTRKYGGTGLGLVISKNILDKMGSDIKMNSQPDKGTGFSFTLNLEYLPAVKSDVSALHFDPIRLLEAFNGDKNFCREIITESLKNLDEHISIIESKPEMEKIRLSAHSIKGLCLNIYCPELSKMAAKLQHEAETGIERKNLGDRIKLIKNEFTKIKPLLLEFISS